MLNSCPSKHRFSVLKFIKLAAMACSFILAEYPARSQGQIVSPSYHLKLAWNAHPDPSVTSYRVHYGTATGSYTAQLSVGNFTQTTLSGLTAGTTYYVAVTALNASGTQSAYSSEVTFVPGKHAVSLGANLTSTGNRVLKIRGVIGRRYDIQASQDLKTWSVINSAIMPDGGSMEFTDPNSPLLKKRFYRTREVL